MSLLNAPNPFLTAPGLIGAAWNGHWTWHVPVGSKALKPGPASHWASRPEHTTSASQQVPDKRPLAGARPLLIDDGMHTARGHPQNPSPRPADTRTSRLIAGAQGRAKAGREGGARGGARVTCQHAHHRQQDLLHALHRAPPLRAALVAHGVVARRVKDGDADSAVRVDCGGQNTPGERRPGTRRCPHGCSTRGGPAEPCSLPEGLLSTPPRGADHAVLRGQSGPSQEDLN